MDLPRSRHRRDHGREPVPVLRAIRNVLLVIIAFSILVIIVRSRTDGGGSDRPTSLVSYLGRRGGQEVVVPDGVYTGGTVTAAHGDWLVLRAQSPGGVVIDLSEDGLRLDPGTSKVVFVGFVFVNGEIQLEGVTDVHFWYCEFTFPPAEWRAQYEAAGGTMPADREARDEFAEKLANPLPTAVRFESSGPPRDSRRVGFWGSDFHDIADDGIFLAWARDVRMAGLRIWNVDEGDADPGQDLGSSEDWFHNDGIQTIGGLDAVELTDSWIGQKVQWAAERADITNARFNRLWLAGSSTFGQITARSGDNLILDNTQQDIVAFANGQSGSGYDPTHDNFRTDFVDGDQRAVWPNQFFRSGAFEVVADGVRADVPFGITVTGGRLANVHQIRDHPENPANVWRRANPYDSYRAVLELP